MGKGRDIDLVQLRNEALLRRVYYWHEVQGLRWDRMLTILSRQEFFIAEETIERIIARARRLSEYSSLPREAKAPRLTYRQLALFKDADGEAIESIHRQSRSERSARKS